MEELFKIRTVALLCLRCCLEDLEHFWVASKAYECVFFQDIVLFRKERNKKGVTYLMELIYQDDARRHIDMERTFSLIHYLHSYKLVSGAISKQSTGKDAVIDHLRKNPKMKYVFYTNMHNVEDWEFLVSSSSDPINVDGDVFGFGPDVFESEELQSFAAMDHRMKNAIIKNNIYLYSKQPHPNEIDKEIKKLFKKLTGPSNRSDKDLDEIVRKFGVFIEEWARGWLGGHYLLTKEHVIKKITEILLQPFMINFNTKKLVSQTGEELDVGYSVWKRIVKDKNLIVVNGSDEVVERFIRKFVLTFIDLRLDSLTKSVSSKDLLRIPTKTISSLEVYEYLWKICKLPLVIQVFFQSELDEIKRILELAQGTVRTLILNQSKVAINDIKSTKTMYTVSDLKEDQQRRLFSFPIKLQGRKWKSFNKFCSDIKEVSELEVKDIIYILCNKFNIGEEFDPLPKCFVNIYLQGVWFKPEVLQNVIGDIFVVRCEYEETFEHFIRKKLNMETSGVVKWEDMNNFKFGYHRIVLYKQLHVLKDIEDYFKNHGDCSVHILIFNGGRELEWVKSLGAVKNLYPFRISQTSNDNRVINQLAIADLWKEKRSIIISSNPGMGKSVLVNYFAQNLSTDFWIVKLNLAQLQKSYRDLANHSHFFCQYLNEECKGNLFLAQAVFAKFYESKSIFVLLDAFDEIPIRYRNVAKEFVNSLRKSGYPVLITTRPILKNDLETLFDTFAFDINPFTKSKQIDFLVRYFSKSSKYKTAAFFAKDLLNTTKNNLNDREFTAVPLHVLLLAEMLLGDFKEFNSIKHFDLLFLFRNITEEKNRIACKKHFGISEDILRHYKTVQTFYALLLLFSEEDLKALQITSKLNYIKSVFPDFFELIQKDGIMVAETGADFRFVHKSFAEYLVGEWLAENIQNENINIAKHLLKATFDYDLKVARNIFDRILAEDCPLHLAVLNLQIGKAIRLIKTNNFDDLDGGNRNFVHLLASWAYRFPKYTNYRLFEIEPKDAEDCELIYVRKQANEDAMLEMLSQIPEYKLHNFKDQLLEYTPLDYAMMNRSYHIANVLCQKMSQTFLNIKNLDQESLSNIFYEMGYLPLIRVITNDMNAKFLIDEVDRDSISYVISRGNTEKLKAVTESLTDFNAKDKLGLIPLHYAVVSNNAEIVKMLIDKGADINATDSSGRTALHWFVNRGNLEIAKLLISKGIKLKTRDVHKRTALHYAAILHPQNLRKAILLYLGSKESLNMIDKEGNTPLLWAAKYGYTNCVSLLLESDIDIEQGDANHMTALHWTAKLGHVDTVEVLLYRGANINRLTLRGITPLMCAASNGHTGIVNLLLDCDADMEVKDHHGMSALDWAAFHGNKDAVRLLLKRQEDIEIRLKYSKQVQEDVVMSG